MVTPCRGKKATAAAQLRKPTAGTPLDVATKVGTTESLRMVTRAFPWNRAPNRRTGARSTHRHRRTGRHRAADQRTVRPATRAATAPRMKLHTPAPANAASAAAPWKKNVSRVSASARGAYVMLRSRSTTAGILNADNGTKSARQRRGAT